MERRYRPRILAGYTKHISIPCGRIFVTINSIHGEEIEVFVRNEVNNPCLNAQNESVTRLISLALQYGVPTEEIVDQLSKIKCTGQKAWDNGKEITSCGDAIAACLSEFSETINSNGSIIGYDSDD